MTLILTLWQNCYIIVLEWINTMATKDHSKFIYNQFTKIRKMVYLNLHPQKIRFQPTKLDKTNLV